MPKTKKILLVGGGTGGHIYPLISVAKELKRSGKCEILFAGMGTSLEKDVFNFENFKWRKITCGKFRRNRSLGSFLQNIGGIFLTALGFIQSLSLIKKFNPDIIFSKGSSVSVPVHYAARFLKKPFLIHESDAMPSLTTRICSKSARAVFTAFPVGIYPLWLRRKAIYTGLPLRDDFQKIKSIGSDYILVVGGSSGALRLNDKIFKILPVLIKHHRVIHLVGPNETRAQAVKDQLDKKYRQKYEFFPYRSDMANLLKDAKLVISRSGATSIFESAMLGKKTILVPIDREVAPHQSVNAEVLSNLRLAKVVKEYDGDKYFLQTIEEFIADKKMSSISSLFFPQSEVYIASLINDYLDFEKINKLRKVFMIGIGGVSMKAVSHLLTKMGIKTSGSDLKTGGHSSKNINLSYDMVVYSSAASAHSPARVEHNMAKKLKIPLLKRSQLIGELMKGYRGISVAGMHGKTSTSMIIARVLERGLLSPSYLIGAEYKESEPSYALGEGIDFVSEACEYDGSFLDFSSKIAVITNIEKEHLDYFKGGMPEILATFKKFIFALKPGGLLVYCYDDVNTRELVEKNYAALTMKKIKLISYGFEEGAMARLSAYKVQEGECQFKIDKLAIKTRKAGRFFALNCAAAFAVAKFLAVSDEDIKAALSNFSGASRRFEYLGEKGGVLVYDDYGHHPTEIRATASALQEAYPQKRKFLIFQPHQQKRFNDFYKQYQSVFDDLRINCIGILPVYTVPGRDVAAEKTSEDLVRSFKDDKRFYFLEDYETALAFLRKNLRKGDVLMTMGATDVYKIAEEFLKH